MASWRQVSGVLMNYALLTAQSNRLQGSCVYLKTFLCHSMPPSQPLPDHFKAGLPVWMTERSPVFSAENNCTLSLTLTTVETVKPT